MKILHLGDLHLGKRVNEISMIEDQKFILDQIVTLVKEEKIDVILLCGDIYDKAIPTIEAIHLLDEFLEELSDLKVKVLMISRIFVSSSLIFTCSIRCLKHSS